MFLIDNRKRLNQQNTYRDNFPEHQQTPRLHTNTKEPAKPTKNNDLSTKLLIYETEIPLDMSILVGVLKIKILFTLSWIRHYNKRN